jgi:hypothetical protein
MKRIKNSFITIKLTCRELAQRVAKVAIRLLMFIRNKSPQRLAVNVQRLVSTLADFTTYHLTVAEALKIVEKEKITIELPRTPENAKHIAQIRLAVNGLVKQYTDIRFLVTPKHFIEIWECETRIAFNRPLLVSPYHLPDRTRQT